MTIRETGRMGQKGMIKLPASLCQKYGLKEGSLVIAEERDEGILIKPADASLVETYSAERKAEFLLSNAVDETDYREAVEEVKKMGIDPEKIPHYKPAGA